jgi:uridine kinase
MWSSTTQYYRDRTDLDIEATTRLSWSPREPSKDREFLRRGALLAALKEGARIDMHRSTTARPRVPDGRGSGGAGGGDRQGILVFVDQRVRDRLDMNLRRHRRADIRVFRRIRRDMEQRGRTLSRCASSTIETVRPVPQFVRPTEALEPV